MFPPFFVTLNVFLVIQNVFTGTLCPHLPFPCRSERFSYHIKFFLITLNALIVIISATLSPVHPCFLSVVCLPERSEGSAKKASQKSKHTKTGRHQPPG